MRTFWIAVATGAAALAFVATGCAHHMSTTDKLFADVGVIFVWAVAVSFARWGWE